MFQSVATVNGSTQPPPETPPPAAPGAIPPTPSAPAGPAEPFPGEPGDVQPKQPEPQEEDELAARVSVIAADVERMFERSVRLEGTKLRAELALSALLAAGSVQLNLLQNAVRAMDREDWQSYRHHAEAIHQSAAELAELLAPIVAPRVVQPPRLVAVS